MSSSSSNTTNSNGVFQDSTYSRVDLGSYGGVEIVDLVTPHSSPGVSAAPSIDHFPNDLNTLEEATLSEETLLALGIDIGEIRAQRDIERGFEARQLEYALQLQSQLNMELRIVTTGTPTASTTSTAHAATPPSPPQPQRTHAQTSSSANPNRGAIEAPSVNSPSKRRTIYSDTQLQNKRQRFNGAAATTPTTDQHMIPSSSSSSEWRPSLLPGETSILENGSLVIPTSTDDNSQIPEQPQSLTASLPTQSLSKSWKEAGKKMRKQTVKDLLSAQEITTGGQHIEATQVPISSNLKVALMEHQKAGYNWMCQKEDSELKGGLLADDMGLGKTVQSLALITGRPCTDAPLVTPPYIRENILPVKSKATLIICPINLVSQWAQEVEAKTENLAVYKHQGSDRLTDPYAIASNDVIIMPYSIVTNDLDPHTIPNLNRKTGCLTQITFHRVILDEAHVVKNWSTFTARNWQVIQIKATYRWCLTASPLQTQIADLYGLFAFLKFEPYCDHNTFNQQLLKPTYQGVSVTDKIQSIMKIICLRRLKNAQTGGQPIVTLPQVHENIIRGDLGEFEQENYSSVNAEVQVVFELLTREGRTVSANYLTSLALLTRLQKACLHPYLPDPALAVGTQYRNYTIYIRNARALDRTVVNRLKISLQDDPTTVCPICMDTAEDATIIPGCGHILCWKCLESYIRSDNAYLPNKLCPECRGPLDRRRLVPITVFIETFLLQPPTSQKQLDPITKTKPSKKIELLLDILKATREQSGGHDKTIVFTQFSSFQTILVEHLFRNGYKAMRYDSSVSTENRLKTLDRFRTDPAVDVLLMSMKQGNVGLNLDMANRVVLMDVGWNSSLEDQAIGRVLRIGQTKEVHVYRLIINNTVEERISEYYHRTKEVVANTFSGEGNLEECRIGPEQMANFIRGGSSPVTSPATAGPST